MAPSAAARRAEVALTLLYQWDVTGRPPAALRGRDRRRTRRASPRPSSATPPSSTRGSPRPPTGWTADRLGAVERNILRIAIHELDGGEVPPEAVIDEAVTLAKRYASEEAATARERDPRPDRAEEAAE